MFDASRVLRGLPPAFLLCTCLAALAACARSDDAWRGDLADPKSEPFDRALAAIALARQATDGLGGVPSNLLEVLDYSTGVLLEPSRKALLDIAPAALPEMATCLVNNIFSGEVSKPTLESAIERHGGAAVPALVDAMPDSTDPRAERVVRIVARIGEPAVGPLIQILQEGPPMRRARAAQLLGSLGMSAVPALAALEAAAVDADPAVATLALASLPRANPEGWRVEPVLRKGLAHPDPAVREAAAAGLARVFLRRAAKFPPGSGSKRREDILSEIRQLDDAAMPTLVEALARPSSPEARTATELLARSAACWSLMPRDPRQDTRGVGEEVQRLTLGPSTERCLAALEIGRRGRRAADAVPALLRAIDDMDPALRTCAALSLALLAIDFGREAIVHGREGGG